MTSQIFRGTSRGVYLQALRWHASSRSNWRSLLEFCRYESFPEAGLVSVNIESVDAGIARPHWGGVGGCLHRQSPFLV